MHSLNTFEVGSFYGLTAPLMVLTGNKQVNSLLNTIEGTSSVENLTALDIELTTLKMLLEQDPLAESKVKYNDVTDAPTMLRLSQEEYPNLYELWGKPQTPPDVMKNHSKSVRACNRALKLFSEGEVPTKQLEVLGVQSEEQVKEMQRVLEDLRASSNNISASVTTDTGEVVLSLDALNMLRVIMSTALKPTRTGEDRISWLVGRIDSTQKTRITAARKFFNIELSNLMRMKSPYSFEKINNAYATSMNSTSLTEELITKHTVEYLRDCDTLLNSSKEVNNLHSNSLPTVEQYKALRLPDKEDLVYKLLPDQEDRDIFYELEESIGVHSYWFDENTVKAYIQFYKTHVNLLSTLKSFMPDTLTDDDYQNIFNELAHAGIIGLTVYGKELLQQALSDRELARPSKGTDVVEEDTELYRNCKIMKLDAESKLYYYKYKDEGGFILE